MKTKFTHIVKSIIPFFAALFIQGALLAAISSGYRLLSGNPDIPESLEYNITVAVVFSCGLIFAFWYIKITGRSLREILLIKKARLHLSMLLIIPLGIGCQFFVSGIIGLIRDVFVKTFSDYGNAMEAYCEGNPIIVVIYLIILAPAAEELIFRGVIMNKALRGLTFTEANLLQAIFFGINHWNPVRSTYAFLIALLLGYVLKKYGTLAAPVMLHMVINASSFLVRLVPSGSLYAAAAAISGGMISAACIIYIMKVMKYKRN